MRRSSRPTKLIMLSSPVLSQKALQSTEYHCSSTATSISKALSPIISHLTTRKSFSESSEMFLVSLAKSKTSTYSCILSTRMKFTSSSKKQLRTETKLCLKSTPKKLRTNLFISRVQRNTLPNSNCQHISS